MRARVDAALTLDAADLDGDLAPLAESLVDELLDGLADQAAQGHWTPDPDSEARRLALLPQSA